MKKTIIIECFLLAILALLLYQTIIGWQSLHTLFELYDSWLNEINTYAEFLERYRVVQTTVVCVAFTIGIVFDIAVIVLIAIKDFPLINAKVKALKEHYKADRQSKQKQKKQQKVDKLQAELEQLKTDKDN